MEMDKFKWNEGMALRCIARHERELLLNPADVNPGPEKVSLRAAAAERNDKCWAAFDEEMKKLITR